MMSIVAVLVALAGACEGSLAALGSGEGPSSSDPRLVEGRTLWMFAEDPLTQESVYYIGPNVEGDVLKWAMVPEEEGNHLAAVWVLLINKIGERVDMVVDEGAAELVTADGVIHRPINSVERAYNVWSTDPDLTIDDFLPIWGSLTLNQGEQVTGYMVFEVPAGSEFEEFRWSASDTAIVRYE